MIDISDIKVSVSHSTFIKDKFFKNAVFLKDARNRLLSYSGGYTVVFVAKVKEEKWAYRCWHTPISDPNNRYALISKSLKKSKLPYFCEFEYSKNGILVNGTIYPTSRMKWIDGLNLKSYLSKYATNTKRIERLAKEFLLMVSQLHANKIAHGDLQHGNIIVSEDNRLHLVDYDSLYVPEMKNKYKDSITGLRDYQHPCRSTNTLSSYKLDYFSEVIIYLSIIAISLQPQFVEKYKIRDTESLLFQAKDFEDLRNSNIYKDLKNLKNKTVDLCLNVLSIYLEEKDISKLNPLESYLSSIEINYPKIVPENENFIITWNSKGANRLEISGIGEVSLYGKREFSLNTSSSFTFSLYSANGYKTTKKITVRTAPRGKILFFKADKNYTIPSVPILLSWKCTGMKKIEISSIGIVEPSGNQIVYPKGDTSFILSANDEFGVIKQELFITELPLPSIKEISVPAPFVNCKINLTYNAPKFNYCLPPTLFETFFSKLRIGDLSQIGTGISSFPKKGIIILTQLNKAFEKLYIKLYKNILK